MRDWLNQLTATVALVPQVGTDDTALVGPIVDHGNAECVMYVVGTGTLSDANATFAITLEHGDASNLSDTASAAAFLSGTTTFDYSADSATRKILYNGLKRYGRLTVTPTGNTGNVPVAAIALLAQQRKQPTS